MAATRVSVICADFFIKYVLHPFGPLAADLLQAGGFGLPAGGSP
jgi:hypothetical protein